MWERERKGRVVVVACVCALKCFFVLLGVRDVCSMRTHAYTRGDDFLMVRSSGECSYNNKKTKKTIVMC